MKIGVMGSNQIQHIIPLLEMKHEVVNLQSNWDRSASSFSKLVGYIKDLRKVDVVYNVFTSPYFWKKAKIAKMLQKKVLTHWIGTDARYTDEGRVNFKKLKYIDKHISCFQAISDQLAGHNIDTEIVPIVPFKLKFDLAKMPEKDSVLIYMPKGVESDYGYEEISKVFPMFPDLKFNIVANDDKEKFSKFKNVYVLGRLPLSEMEHLYDNISIVVRIHVNDGLSMSVLEALAKGKRVIWNYDFPYCLPGKTAEEIIESINISLKESPEPDIEAHNFLVENYSKEKVLMLYDKIFEEMVDIK